MFCFIVRHVYVGLQVNVVCKTFLSDIAFFHISSDCHKFQVNLVTLVGDITEF